jgi:hypothetical protein
MSRSTAGELWLGRQKTASSIKETKISGSATPDPGRLRRKEEPHPTRAWGGARHANLALRRLAKDDGRGEVVA